MSAEAVTIRAAAELAEALREIDTSAQLPQTYLDQMEAGNARPAAEWWKHVASKRREVAAAALARWEAREQATPNAAEHSSRACLSGTRQPSAALGVRLREIEARARELAGDVLHGRVSPNAAIGLAAEDVPWLGAQLRQMIAEHDEARVGWVALTEKLEVRALTAEAELERVTAERDALADCDCVTVLVSSKGCAKCGRRGTITSEAFTRVLEANNERDRALAAAVAESERLKTLVAAWDATLSPDCDGPERDAVRVALAGGAAAPPPEKVTHGRHCSCSACAREDWTRITGPCGMHGKDCPAVYAPIPPAVASNGEET